MPVTIRYKTEEPATEVFAASPQLNTTIESAWWDLPNRSTSGRNVNINSSLTYAPVWACARVLSESVAVLPCHLYQKSDEETRERASKHPLYKILNREPNDYQTAFEFWEQAVFRASLEGNFYALIHRDDGRVTSLTPITSDVRVVLAPGNPLPFYGVTTKTQGEQFYSFGEIFHLKGPSFDGLTGLSVIAYARNAIGAGLSMEEYGARFFENDSTPGGFLETPLALGPEKKKELRKQFQKYHQGASKAHRLAVLEEGMKFSPVSVSPEDSQFIESRGTQVADIARFFRMPPHKIGDLTRATFSNIESQELSFLTDTVQPWLRRIEQTISKLLLLPKERDTFYPEFLVDVRQRVETEPRYRAHSIGITAGFLTPNEARKLENLPPKEGGDELLSPLNMAPATDRERTEQDNSSAQIARALQTMSANRPAPEPEEETFAAAGKQRSDLANSRKEEFGVLARKVLSREIPAVRKIIEEHSGNKETLKTALAAYYETHSKDVEKIITPLYRSYSDEIRRLSATEAKKPAPDVDEFVGEVIGSAAQKWSRGSSNQLASLIDETPEGFADASLTRLDEWNETRPDKFSQEEAVRVGGAVARAVFVALGTLLVSRTTGGGCPFCEQLDGKVVGATEPFLSAGDTLSPPGKEPMKINTNKMNPPYHRSCSCVIVAE